jgi:hypothetical protein
MSESKTTTQPFYDVVVPKVRPEVPRFFAVELEKVDPDGFDWLIAEDIRRGKMFQCRGRAEIKWLVWVPRTFWLERKYLTQEEFEEAYDLAGVADGRLYPSMQP